MKEEVKITMEADVSTNDTALRFEKAISLEIAGHIIRYIGEIEKRHINDPRKP